VPHRFFLILAFLLLGLIQPKGRPWAPPDYSPACSLQVSLRRNFSRSIPLPAAKPILQLHRCCPGVCLCPRRSRWTVPSSAAGERLVRRHSFERVSPWRIYLLRFTSACARPTLLMMLGAAGLLLLLACVNLALSRQLRHSRGTAIRFASLYAVGEDSSFRSGLTISAANDCNGLENDLGC
jgi:hypothetical protein